MGTVSFGTTFTWTLVFSLWKEFTSTWNQRNTSSTSRNPLLTIFMAVFCLLDFQSFTEKPVFKTVCFWSSYGVILSYLLKNSIYRISVICKLAMKEYLVHMCASWLCSFKPCRLYFVIIKYNFVSLQVKMQYLNNLLNICICRLWPIWVIFLRLAVHRLTKVNVLIVIFYHCVWIRESILVNRY